MKKIFKYSGLLLLVGAILACTDNLNKTVTGEALYQPEYSLPIGPAKYTLGSIMPKNVLVPVLDTALINDSTIHKISYDSMLFLDPFGHNARFILPYDFSMLADQANKIRSLMFRANYINGFPTYFDLQVYFLDGNLNVLDSLFSDGTYRVEAADIDQNGNVTTRYAGQKDTYLDSTKIEHLINTKSLELNIYVATNRSGQKIVHFYSSSAIDLQFAVRAQLEIPLGY